MIIRNNTPKASQRRHFINRRCSEAQPTDTKAILIVSPARGDTMQQCVAPFGA
jgi:hypothetical protein